MIRKILFFASLREAAGTGELQIDLPDGISIDTVWQQLSSDMQNLPGKVLCAVNQDYVELTHQLVDTDHEIAFFPPVTGG
jgi:molybdopterin synthase sulfur carrier subunit